LLTDDTGPTHNNLVDNNLVTDNSADPGITMPGHNPHALSATGQPEPSVAGVYHNTIKHNEVTGNGAGVLVANATSGTAAYDNLIEDNYMAGNAMAGVSMHAYLIAPGQFEDLDGNQVTGNVINTNNAGGDTAGDLVTTGVLVSSAGAPVTVAISDNHISHDAIGIWLSQAVTASGLTSNTFSDVTTPISANH
jgi:Right handed beta helix region